jgi:hypothetical protein
MNVNNTIHRTVLAAVIGATLALGVGAPAFAREPTAAQEQQHKHDKKQRDEARQQALDQRIPLQAVAGHDQEEIARFCLRDRALDLAVEIGVVPIDQRPLRIRPARVAEQFRRAFERTNPFDFNFNFCPMNSLKGNSETQEMFPLKNKESHIRRLLWIDICATGQAAPIINVEF